MDVVRTPEVRFANLEGYPFPPHYLDVTATGTAAVRMHYLDEGPRDGAPVVLLHGEPTWSYLYRTMIPPLVAAGHRVLAPDLIGFGRSDKPTRAEDYTYLRHVEWTTSWLTTLDLREVTVVVQDWGSLIGLRVAAENPERFSKLFIANGFLPIGDRPASPAFRIWRAFAKYSPWLPSGRLVDVGTVENSRPRCAPGMTPHSPTRVIRPAPGASRNWFPPPRRIRRSVPTARHGRCWAPGQSRCCASSAPTTRSSVRATSP
jgi:haloalkane dehalogenase